MDVRCHTCLCPLYSLFTSPIGPQQSLPCGTQTAGWSRRLTEEEHFDGDPNIPREESLLEYCFPNIEQKMRCWNVMADTLYTPRAVCSSRTWQWSALKNKLAPRVLVQHQQIWSANWWGSGRTSVIHPLKCPWAGHSTRHGETAVVDPLWGQQDKAVVFVLCSSQLWVCVHMAYNSPPLLRLWIGVYFW